MKSKSGIIFIFFFLIFSSWITVYGQQMPKFQSDSAYFFLERQLQFGYRIPGTAAHLQTRDYFIEILKKFGLEVSIQEFNAEIYNGENFAFYNIIGSINPEQEERILLAAHYDTRLWADKDPDLSDQPLPGANDGASGPAVLLEMARLIQEFPPEIGVDMIFFDGEDYGPPEGFKRKVTIENAGKIFWCLGSQYWSKHPHQEGYEATLAIVLDMVGAKNATFYMEGGSMQFASKYVKRIWKIADEIGHEDYFIRKRSGGIMDDHIFISKRGIPAVDIIDHNLKGEFFKDYHHTQKDNLNLISKNTLQAVGDVLVSIIYRYQQKFF